MCMSKNYHIYLKFMSPPCQLLNTALTQIFIPVGQPDFKTCKFKIDIHFSRMFPTITISPDSNNRQAGTCSYDISVASIITRMQPLFHRHCLLQYLANSLYAAMRITCYTNFHLDYLLSTLNSKRLCPNFLFNFFPHPHQFPDGFTPVTNFILFFRCSFSHPFVQFRRPE